MYIWTQALSKQLYGKTMNTTKEETKLPKQTKFSNHIGTLGEKSLHAELKHWYKQPGDLLEEKVDGFHIDIARQNLLIEIQTANFSSIKSKLITLTKKHRVRLVYPIAQEKWIVRLAADGKMQVGRRKSPKKGNLFRLFEELVSIPDMIKSRNFFLEVLLIILEFVNYLIALLTLHHRQFQEKLKSAK